jgi:predicted RNase H-like nuclease
MRYLGIDLAWGERARTGLAELDPDGRLVQSASVRTDDEIALFLGDRGQGVVAAIDAPLIVSNETGQRPCEREVGRLFGTYHAGAYPANRGNPAFYPEPRGARLTRRFGWDLDPSVRPQPDRSVAIEVYPHPAMVSLFDLGRVIPYKGKKGRDISSRQRAFGDLFTAIEVVCGPLLQLDSSDRWQLLRNQVTGAARQVDLDTVEDEVDAVFCAYLAWLWATDAGAMTVLGDVENGYIVTPLPPNVADDGAAFRLDPEAGAIEFGNGAEGRRPSVDNTVAASYRTGGGAAGALEE